MSKSIPTLAIGDIAVRQRNDLYSLNDLHKAAGNHAKQKPSEWLRNQQTQDLVAEISKAAIPAFETKRGNGAGIYACKELVIAYAAWISATFHLKVIRVFLNAVQPTTPYTVQPSDTLNEAQQIAVRTMLESNVKRLPHEKQAGAMIQGWSKLKAHFGVPYRDIPAHEFTEALSIVSRHVAQWALVDEGPKPVAAPQPINYAARSKAAFDAATRAAGEVQRTVFDAVMNGTDDWKHQRLMLAFIDDSTKGAPAYVQPIESGSILVTWQEKIESIRHGECMNTTAELLDMASACMQRIQHRQPTARALLT